MKDFKKLRIWQIGLEISISCFRLAETLPANERFGLISQLTRAGTSIPSNIAEGSSRKSDKEYGRFLEIALGSCFEVETLLQIMEQLNYGNPDIRTHLFQLVVSENRMLHSFLSALKSC